MCQASLASGALRAGGEVEWTQLVGPGLGLDLLAEPWGLRLVTHREALSLAVTCKNKCRI